MRWKRPPGILTAVLTNTPALAKLRHNGAGFGQGNLLAAFQVFFTRYFYQIGTVAMLANLGVEILNPIGIIGQWTEISLMSFLTSRGPP